MPDRLARLDPRARRTRALLRDTLIELIVERESYGDITIKELTTRAEVSRTTFYLHFKDIDDLLYATMSEIYQSIFDSFYEGEDNQLDPASPQDFQHVAEFADLYRVLLGEKGSPVFVSRVRAFIAGTIATEIRQANKNADYSDIPVEMVAYYMAGAQLGVMDWWLKNDMPYTPEEMAHMLWEICVMGQGWVFDTRLKNAQGSE